MGGPAGRGWCFAILLTAYLSFWLSTGSTSPSHFAWRSAHVTGIFLERNVALFKHSLAAPGLISSYSISPMKGSSRSPRMPHPRRFASARINGWSLTARRRWAGDPWYGPICKHSSVRFLFIRKQSYPPGQPVQERVQYSPSIAWRRSSRMQRRASKISETMPFESYNQLTTAMDKLHEIAASPSSARTIRHLALPEAVVLSYSGAKSIGGGFAQRAARWRVRRRGFRPARAARLLHDQRRRLSHAAQEHRIDPPRRSCRG